MSDIFCDFTQHIPEVTESDHKVLERVKKIEQKKLKQGYQWVQINTQTQILVKCDKNGKPTKEGQEQINHLKTNSRI